MAGGNFCGNVVSGEQRSFLSTTLNQDFNLVKHLTKDFIWRALIAGWTNSHRQHDVVEFAAFFCKKHRIALVTGEWEARTNVDGVGQPGDAGSCAQPILLHLPSTPPGLGSTLKAQSVVDQWYAQEAIHACTVLPSVLMLQLGRFQVCDGRVVKVHTPVQVNDNLWIPSFMNANFQVRPVKYERIAVLCRHGEHPKAGHYQAILHSASGCWSCDDNRGSHRCDEIPSWCSSSCYMLLYRRAQHPTLGDLGEIPDHTDHHCFPILHA